MKKIAILVLDGVMDSSLAITLDTLRAAQLFLKSTHAKQQVEIQTVGFRKYAVTGAGLRITLDRTFKAAQEKYDANDWIIMPAPGLRSDVEIDARLAQADAIKAMQWLGSVARGGVRVGTSCSGSFLLAQAGLLTGRNATTTWWLARTFRERFPDVNLDETRMLVRDGTRWTAGAAFSQLDLVLAIVTDVMGPAVAHLCSRYLLIDQRPSQARYMMQDHLLNTDTTVIAAQRWIDANLASPITIGTLSSELAVAPKTLARRIEAVTGVSPIKFVQRRRLTHAAHLLETTSLSIEEIAAQVGYRDGTALRKLVKREFGITPSAMR
ncbi:hypothetical protein BH11PSE11_BH11PSE11_27180 [soil metagenome]